MSEAKGWFARNIYDPNEGKPKVSPAPGGMAPPVAGAQPALSPQNVMPGGMAPATPITYGLDPQMVQDVQRVVERRPTPFTQLEQNAQQLADVIPDEVTRTKAAFKMLKGASGPQVISSIDLHVRDIEQEKAGFAAQAQQAMTKKAGALRAEAEQLLRLNQSDEQRIQQLEQEIQMMRNKIGERSTSAHQKQIEAGTEETNIQATVQKFTAAADAAIATLNTKKTQLSSMLA